MQCWECGHGIEADQDSTLSILRVVDPDRQPGEGTVAHAVQNHLHCAPSRIQDYTPTEFAQLQAGHAADTTTPPPGAVDDLALMATVGGTAEQPYPVVFFSYRSDVIAEHPGADRVDLLTSGLLARGWHPITTLLAPPPPGPAGHRLDFRHVEPADDAPGQVRLVDADDLVESSGVVVPFELWRVLVRQCGWTVVVHGSNYLADQESMMRAVESGLLVGGIVPVLLNGPGNTGEGSVYA
ncbi:MAG: hypothetical protein ABIQ18_15275 [Umezawaea sp.]